MNKKELNALKKAHEKAQEVFDELGVVVTYLEGENKDKALILESARVSLDISLTSIESVLYAFNE